MTHHPAVLLIDDDPVGTAAITSLLREAGYTVEHAPNGQRGLEQALSGRFRIVITDWMMPDMPGTELSRRVREADLPCYVYVLMLSQKSKRSDVVEGLNSGVDDYITKPVAEGELLARVRNAERMLSLITRDVTIFSLAKLAESRDPDTGAHLERVRHFSRLLAEHLRSDPDYEDVIDGEFIRMIYLTSPLHDIGKVGIPDSVLLKPDRLTDAEFALMQTHTTIGASTLEAALQAYPEALYLQMARDIALTHHERFDGTGYPLGLRGRSIPIAGRIVALADAYDALTSKRVYKSAVSHEMARSAILEQSGKQFDPDVVEAFVSQEPMFRHIRDRFSDNRATFSVAHGSLRSAA